MAPSTNQPIIRTEVRISNYELYKLPRIEIVFIIICIILTASLIYTAYDTNYRYGLIADTNLNKTINKLVNEAMQKVLNEIASTNKAIQETQDDVLRIKVITNDDFTPGLIDTCATQHVKLHTVTEPTQKVAPTGSISYTWMSKEKLTYVYYICAFVLFLTFMMILLLIINYICHL